MTAKDLTPPSSRFFFFLPIVENMFALHLRLCDYSYKSFFAPADTFRPEVLLNWLWWSRLQGAMEDSVALEDSGALSSDYTSSSPKVPCASHCFPICYVFIDWGSRYNLHEIFATCVLDQKTMRGPPHMILSRIIKENWDKVPFVPLWTLPVTRKHLVTKVLSIL